MNTEPKVGIRISRTGLMKQVELSSVIEDMMREWSDQECSTFILCLVSEMLDRNPLNHDLVFDMANEIRALACETCIEVE